MSEFSDNLPHRLEFPCIYVLHKRGLVKYLPTKVDNIFVRCKFLWHEKALYTQKEGLARRPEGESQQFLLCTERSRNG